MSWRRWTTRWWPSWRSPSWEHRQTTDWLDRPWHLHPLRRNDSLLDQLLRFLNHVLRRRLTRHDQDSKS